MGKGWEACESIGEGTPKGDEAADAVGRCDVGAAVHGYPLCGRAWRGFSMEHSTSPLTTGKVYNDRLQLTKRGNGEWVGRCVSTPFPGFCCH